MSKTSERFAEFFREVRRRRVYHVAAIYAAAAFIAAQAAELVVSALHLPHWVFTAAVILAFLGFPVALALAWVFDITPTGVIKAAPAPGRSAAVPISLPRLALAAVVLLMLGAAGYAALAHVRQPRTPVGLSLAVLPFVNLAGSEAEEYFSDGLTEDVLTTVARVGQIRVISRTSVMPYKHTEKGVREIADELSVSHILTGSVRRDQNRVRVSVQLVDARADEHLWAELYERELAGIFVVQAEIAQHIARELGARLTPAERQRIAVIPTHDPVAYDYLLRSREYVARGRPEEHEIAIEMARAAIQRDTAYANAYAALGMNYTLKVQRYGAGREWLDSASVLASRAIALDSLSASGHHTLGATLLVGGRFDEAAAPLEKTVDLDPSHGAALINLGILHGWQGRLAECVYWLERAAAIDPGRADQIQYNLAVSYSLLGMYAHAEEALAQARRLRPDWWYIQSMAVTLALYRGDMVGALAGAEALIEAHPLTAPAWLEAGEAYLYAGDVESAARAFAEAYRLAPTTVSAFAYAPVRLAQVLARLGEADRAAALLEEFDTFAAAELGAGNHSSELQLSRAAVALLRGEATVALERLEDAISAGWINTTRLRLDPLFEELHGRQDFESILARVDARVRQMRSQLLERSR